MPERFNFKIGIPGDEGPSRMMGKMTLNRAIELINSKGYPSTIKEKLIADLKRRPNNTYENFLKNIYSHLQKIQKVTNLVDDECTKENDPSHRLEESPSDSQDKEICGDELPEA